MDLITLESGLMKQFVEELGQWLRHKNKNDSHEAMEEGKTIYRNSSYLN